MVFVLSPGYDPTRIEPRWRSRRPANRIAASGSAGVVHRPPVGRWQYLDRRLDDHFGPQPAKLPGQGSDFFYHSGASFAVAVKKATFWQTRSVCPTVHAVAVYPVWRNCSQRTAGFSARVTSHRLPAKSARYSHRSVLFSSFMLPFYEPLLRLNPRRVIRHDRKNDFQERSSTAKSRPKSSTKTSIAWRSRTSIPPPPRI